MAPPGSADTPPKPQIEPPYSDPDGNQVAIRFPSLTRIAATNPWYGFVSQFPEYGTYSVPFTSVSAP